jgi:GNAT superfamily N-acetyltransferase
MNDQRIELAELTEQNELMLVALLKNYGEYMFGALGLTDGKERLERELADFPVWKYTAPMGCFLLAFANGKAVACAGITKLDDEHCELKRMFTLPDYRRMRIATRLLDELILKARILGYCEILLDTNQEMTEAVLMYEKRGFVRTEAYCVNENPRPVYLRYEVDRDRPGP